MQASVEISFYPIRDAYLAPIEAVIAALEAAPDVEIVVNPMSTQVHGDYGAVMAAVTGAMETALEQAPGAFVLKVLGIDARAPHPRP
ncbi:MAG: thiamine-binding protein [Pseudomonadales bacterium]|jgi:uncharacterized protein YqgV (UPF0045/DUF77 family)|nr:thiamine-binding protein [Pseudomonadales bacterium]